MVAALPIRTDAIRYDTPDALRHCLRALIRMPRRANDNNPNMPVYEG